MKKDNSQMLDEYLASRHVDPKLQPKPIVEYFCSTCLLNTTLDKFEQFEKMNKRTYTPIQGRKVDDVGIIFTANSMMAEFHFKTRGAHDWGLYQPHIKRNGV